MQKIMITKTIDLEQAWMAKDEAIIYFGYQKHKSTFQKMLGEFKVHKDFKSGYLLPTPNVPLINLNKFAEFLVWREKNKYRRNKS